MFVRGKGRRRARPGAVTPSVVGLSSIRPTFPERVRRDEAGCIRVVLMILPAVTGYGRAAEAEKGCKNEYAEPFHCESQVSLLFAHVLSARKSGPSLLDFGRCRADITGVLTKFLTTHGCHHAGGRLG